MPHAIEMKDGKILTPFGIKDLLEAVSDYAGEDGRSAAISTPISGTLMAMKRNLNVWNRRTKGWLTTTGVS